MGRAPCSSEDKEALKKGAWTAEEDEKLVSFIQRNKGHGSWRTLPKLAGLSRCGKSCRLRWTNYLRPNIKRGNFSAEEERIIIQLHAFMGNKWSSIASHLPGRTDNEVKNHWNTHLKKRLTKLGIDPMTHLPLQHLTPHIQEAGNYYSVLTNNQYLGNIDDWKLALLQRSLQLDPTIARHLVQWELARLEAEARMQVAASSQDQTQNYALWLQSLQSQLAPGYSLNDAIMHALNLQLQAALTASNASLVDASAPLQPAHSYCEAKDHLLLKQLNPWEQYGESQRLASPSLINNQNSRRGVPIIESEGPVYTSACSMATPETCSSESTSQLLCDQLQLPDLLSSNEMMPTTLSPPSPLHLDDANHLPHDSYWNKILSLLGSQAAPLLDV